MESKFLAPTVAEAAEAAPEALPTYPGDLGAPTLPIESEAQPLLEADLSDNAPISARHRELARLLALGTAGGKVAEILGFTPARVSVLKSHPRIKLEIQRFQDRMFDKDMTQRFKHMGAEAANVIENVILSTDPDIKPQLKVDTAKWILEKLTGKARQEVDLGDKTLGAFFDLIESIKDGTNPALDVIPQPENQGMASDAPQQIAIEGPKPPDWGSWVKDNT